MSEIEKLYAKAGIYQKCCTINDCLDMSKCSNCHFNKVYAPPFTAEKQLELIKRVSPSYPLNYHIKCFQGYTFEEGLALCVNNLWQCLPEEEKEVVRGILRT